MQRGKQHISRLHASAHYRRFLAAYDEFVRRVVLWAPEFGGGQNRFAAQNFQ